VHHHGSYIIFTAVGICEINQCIAYFLRTRFLTKFFEQILAPYHLPETIRTKQECITGLQGLVEDVYFDCFMTGAKRAINQIALWMCVNVLWLNLLCLDQPGYQRVVFRNGGKLPIA